jgi:hypothetical protein
MSSRPFNLSAPIADEADEQAALMTWAQSAPVRRQYPALEWLAAIPNGLAASSIGAARRMKEQGMKSGVPDLVLPIPAGGYHGLWIELKRRRGGRVSPEQRAWIAHLNQVGYRAEVCAGWDAARELILNYLSATASSCSSSSPSFSPF